MEQEYDKIKQYEYDLNITKEHSKKENIRKLTAKALKNQSNHQEQPDDNLKSYSKIKLPTINKTISEDTTHSSSPRLSIQSNLTDIKKNSIDNNSKKIKIYSNNKSDIEEESSKNADLPVLKKIYNQSKAGRNDQGVTKTNQDSVLRLENVLGIQDYNIIGILDGHGQNGHDCSQEIVAFFDKYFNNLKNYGLSSKPKKNEKYLNLDVIINILRKDDYNIIKKGFKKAEQALKKASFDALFSGSTCCIILQLGKLLISANVGDSRGIMVKKYKSSKSNKMKHKCKAISRDHKPELDKERKRIEQCGGRIEQFFMDGQFTGPYRVWFKNENYPGLAMARSIGDILASEVGVICEPEIMEFDVTDDVEYIAIASDGVWEFLENEDVMKILNKYKKSNEIDKGINKVIELSTKCWLKEDVVVDDISLIFAEFL